MKIGTMKIIEYSPPQKIVKHCIQGMAMEDAGQSEEAKRIFPGLWRDASNDYEKYLAAYYVARHQNSATDALDCLRKTLDYALKIDDISVRSILPSLNSQIGNSGINYQRTKVIL